MDGSFGKVLFNGLQIVLIALDWLVDCCYSCLFDFPLIVQCLASTKFPIIHRDRVGQLIKAPWIFSIPGMIRCMLACVQMFTFHSKSLSVFPNSCIFAVQQTELQLFTSANVAVLPLCCCLQKTNLVYEQYLTKTP